MTLRENSVPVPAKGVIAYVRVLVWGFFPFYLTPVGIYPGIRSIDLVEQGGFVLPLILMVGTGISLFTLVRMIRRRESGLPKPLAVAFISFFGMTLVVAIAGCIWSKHSLPFFLFIQNLTGCMGIGMAVFFISQENWDFVQICGLISKIFMMYIVIHVSYSYLTIGDETFGRFISNQTPFSAIYQMLIYYPYIVSAVFWFAVPYWRRYRWHWLIYLAVGVYIAIFQVRGALVSYFITLSVYAIIFSQHRMRNALLSVIFCIAFVIIVFKFEYNFARFRPTDLFGQREVFWLDTISKIRGDWTYLIYGTLFFAKSMPSGFKVGLDISVGSQHNQYLDYLKNGGLILLGAYAAGFLHMAFSALRNARKVFQTSQDLIIYWFPILILIQSLIDLNVNTPLRAINPAIYFWFYWVGSYLYLHRKASEIS